MFLPPEVPGPGQREGAAVDRPKPAREVAGGEGRVGGNGGQAKANPMVVFLGLGVVGLGFPRGAVAPAAEEDGGGGAPAADWRQQVGEKPHGSKVKLLGWLGGAEQH